MMLKKYVENAEELQLPVSEIALAERRENGIFNRAQSSQEITTMFLYDDNTWYRITQSFQN